jgi:short-subunit dehydrogenase
LGRRGAVVVGASAGVGRALSYALAQRDYDVVLVARDERDLGPLASDLVIRYGVHAAPIAFDVANSDASLDSLLRRCRSQLGSMDAVLFPVGLVDDCDDGFASWETTDRLLATNFTSVVKLAALCLSEFEREGRGAVVFFSSIAARAPRKRNVVYSAAKAALESYARSMRHRFAASDVHVQLYALGYVDTSMTRGRRLLLPKASATRVATQVVTGLDRGSQFLYLPRWWSVVVRGLSLLPWSVYRRLDF